MNNPFQSIVERYDKELIKDAIALIDWYVDTMYPIVTGKVHVQLDRLARVNFASKVIDCMLETGIEELEIFYESFELNANNKFYQGYDPLIMLITSPKVMGYGLLLHEDIGFECVELTSYQPVNEYY